MISKFKGIYDKSPIFVQNLMTTAYGIVARRNRYQKEYYQHLDTLERLHQLSRKELEDYQFNEMKKLLDNTIEQSKYYRELYEGTDIDLFREIKDLKQLPIVNKEDIRTNIEDTLTIDKKDAIQSSTGGTTGKSLNVYNESGDIQKRMAVLDHFKKINGFVNLKMKKATFMGKEIVPIGQKKKVFWRYNAAIKQMVYSSFHITEENIPYYIDSLNKLKPKAIDGFPSSMYDIAEYMLRKNIQFDFDLVAIFPTAETITPLYRETIEKAFGAKIKDQYASSEGAPFIYECPEGSYHYDITTGVIENKEDSKEILVTSFLNYGTPLIRYAIGDSVVFKDPQEECECGFNTLLVEKIDGRSLDFLYTTDGAKINLGNLSNIVKDFPNKIVRSKFIQNDLEEIHLKIVVDGVLTPEDRQIIENQISYRFGEDIKVRIKEVKELEVESSGKYKMIENNIPD